MGRSRSLNKLFAELSGDKLAEIIAKTARLKSTEQQILDQLPQEICPQVELGEIRDQTLTLICTSSAVATRLRFLETELLAKLSNNSDLPQLRQLRTLVRSRDHRQDPLSRGSAPAARGQQISAASALLLEQTGAIVKNPRLATALKQLARHGSTGLQDLNMKEQMDPEDQAAE